MQRLNPEKLQVTYSRDVTVDSFFIPRRYTLTHSDRTGELFLSIGHAYNLKQVSGFYTRLMRDEVLAELAGDFNNITLEVYCHVSGGLVLGTAKWRYNIFQTELPLALEAIIYGDRNFYKQDSRSNLPVNVHFASHIPHYQKVENWGKIADYLEQRG